MLGVIMSINASGMKDIISFLRTVSKPLALHQLNILIYMEDQNSWEVVVSSLMLQLKNIETTLENQNLSLREFIQENDDKACPAILEAQLRSTQISFNRMENKLHDMIIYLCRAMTESKVHQLSNLLGDDSYGVE